MYKKILLPFLLFIFAFVVRGNNVFHLKNIAKESISIPYGLSTVSCKAAQKIPYNGVIYGLSIDGSFTTTHGDYFLRVILKDKKGKKYVVMESFKEMNDTSNFVFNDYCEESISLNGVQPDSLIVFAFNASIRIDRINVATQCPLKNDDVQAKRKRQLMNIIDKINAYNFSHNRLWRAGITPLSQMSYEDKKSVLGLNDEDCTGGIEYYADGIFEIGSIEERSEPLNSRSSCISEFDWRNRHGKNWITSVKHQGNSGYCAAFTSVAVTEAMAQLYYNRLIGFDLSEQEAACCNGNPTPWTGMPLSSPLAYIRDYGVCDENAYPFVNDPSQAYCRSSEITPNELVSIGNYNEIVNISEEKLKSAIINHGPLCSSVRYWWYNSDYSITNFHHAMAMVGYGVLQLGDTIYRWVEPNGFINGDYVVKEEDPHIGMTYFIYKNSYGASPTDPREGYWYLILHSYSRVGPTYYIEPSITSTSYTDNDILCEDADGDGLYFWGLGNKPNWCPSWIPDMRDGDDNNASMGEMDNYGFLDDLSVYDQQSTVINSNSVFQTDTIIYCNLLVNGYKSLTVKGKFHHVGHRSIIIESGAELIIDGGILTNAYIEMESGSILTIKNGGKIVMRTGTDFIVPQGAIVNLENGEIIRSHDF